MAFGYLAVARIGWVGGLPRGGEVGGPKCHKMPGASNLII